MPLSIRPLVPTDLPIVEPLLQAAFGRPHSFASMLRLSAAAQPGNQVVAELDGRVVGSVGAVNYGEFAYIALLGVDPSYQRRGIASALMDHVRQRLAAEACRVVLLDATDVGAEMYSRMGFVDDSRAYDFHGASPVVPQHLPHVERLGSSALEEIVRYDTPRFGADRRCVLAALLNNPAVKAIARRDAAYRLCGFLFLQHGVLGPWVAEDGDTAEALFLAAQPLLEGAPVRVMVPRSNQIARDLLVRHGIGLVRELRHMRLGGDGPPGQPTQLFGQVSFGLG